MKQASRVNEGTLDDLLRMDSQQLKEKGARQPKRRLALFAPGRARSSAVLCRWCGAQACRARSGSAL
eukprot:6955840-Prymnesium_polylepis.2